MNFRETIKLVAAYTGLTSKRLSLLAGIRLAHASNDLLKSFKMGLLIRRRLPQRKTEFVYFISKKGLSYLNYKNSAKSAIDDITNFILVKKMLENPRFKQLIFLQQFLDRKRITSVPSGGVYSALKKYIRRLL